MSDSIEKPLVTQADKTWDFLNWLLPNGPHHIVTLSSKGNAQPRTKIFRDNQKDELVKFIEEQNSPEARRNIYFLPNAAQLVGNRKKTNLLGAEFLHVDLDMKDYPGSESEQFDRIVELLTKKRPKGVPEPTASWVTGGGFQAVWKLSEPIDVELAEEMNSCLLVVLQGGEGTHDAIRLLRMPGTINWLNDKKRKVGRKPKPSFMAEPIVFTGASPLHSVNDFKLKRHNPKKPNDTRRSGTTVSNTDQTLDSLPLPQNLMEIFPSNPDWVAAIMDGTNPPGKSYQSRSELVFAATIWMLGNEMESGHILSILTSEEFGISAHVLEQPNSVSYATRQISQALETISASSNDWPAVDEKGFPLKNHPDNIRFAFSKLGLSISRNIFSGIDEVVGGGISDRDINDVSDILWSLFIRKLNYTTASTAIKREIIAIASDNRYHPILDYLNGLEWDGNKRIDKWLIDFAGAEDTPFNRSVGQKVLIAAVRRIKKPGVKFDTLLVLEGKQGAGKSRLVGKLAVNSDWFCESLSMKIDDKSKAELLARAWIVEFQELDGIGKVTSHGLKRFLSQRFDTYRKAYGRDARSYQRHCIIIGTTNESDYLRDLTGNRRIWPVQVGEIDLDGFSESLDQLWAEAVVLEATGESLELPNDLWNVASELQKRRLVEDPYSDVLISALEGRTGKVSMESIKQLLGIQSARMTPQDSRRIKTIMADIGWDSGSYRLFDSGYFSHVPRRGFANGSLEERKTEYIAQYDNNRICYLVLVNNNGEEDTPF